MSKFKAACSAASSYIVCFFKQTFRRHTGREYSQFLTRGIRRGEEGVQRAYPWFYIRLFAACVIVFAVYLLILRFTSNALFSPVVVILAALTFNVSFLVLLYEIYPRDDLSLLSVFITLLVGGTGACVLAQIMYMYIPASNGWLAALRAAGVEELSKAVPVVIVVLSLKIRQPLVGFIMGAAVGCGFSVVEDAGYIFVAANDLPALNIPSVVATFFERGATSFCTHTVWTASVGWALACARRSLSAARPFVCLAGAFALHFLWNAPLSGALQAIAVTACVVAAAMFGICSLAASRAAALGEEKSSPPEFFRTDEGSLVRDRLYYIHAGHLCLTFGAFVMALFAIVYCSIPFRETYYAQTFDRAADFVEFMQSGYELSDDFTRSHDPDMPDFFVQTTDGVVTSVTQKVSLDGHDYYYEYTVAGDGSVAIYLLNSVTVELEINGVTSRYFSESLYNMDGTLYASYFRIRPDVTGLNVSPSGDEVTAIVYDPSFEFDYSQPQYAVLFGILGGMAVISVGLYVMFYFISRSKKFIEKEQKK